MTYIFSGVGTVRGRRDGLAEVRRVHVRRPVERPGEVRVVSDWVPRVVNLSHPCGDEAGVFERPRPRRDAVAQRRSEGVLEVPDLGGVGPAPRQEAATFCTANEPKDEMTVSEK